LRYGDALPTVRSKPPAQIDVFCVQEIRLIESADVDEGTTPDEQRYGRQERH
jgi:hypothetical protein